VSWERPFARTLKSAIDAGISRKSAKIQANFSSTGRPDVVGALFVFLEQASDAGNHPS
jgi:hypothetical protein